MKPAFVLRWQSQVMHAPAFWYFKTREAAQRAKDAEIVPALVPDHYELED